MWSTTLCMTAPLYVSPVKQTHTHNNSCSLTHNDRFTALCPGLPGWAGTWRNIHPPTTLIIIQALSASSIYYRILLHANFYLKTATITINCSENCFRTCSHRHDCRYQPFFHSQLMHCPSIVSLLSEPYQKLFPNPPSQCRASFFNSETPASVLQ